VVLEKPVQIVNLIFSNEELLIQPRNLIVLEKNSSFRLVVCDHALTTNHSLGNAVMESFVAANANYDFTLLQNEHDHASLINHHFIYQGENSQVETNTISLHSGLIRNNHFVTLDGEHAENIANGLYLMDKDQYVENHVFIDHAKANCRSEQLYKGVMDDRARGAFSGRILVRKDSQVTEAYQRNNNILLTDEAKMKSKPQLEIYADDVKCSHGATVGQIDKEAMFYLRSRGISKKEARLMMMYGFTHDVIKKIHEDSLRERIEELVYKRLQGELAKCENCGFVEV
jgi:Fe-S cluster assembly protein SufD